MASNEYRFPPQFDWILLREKLHPIGASRGIANPAFILSSGPRTF